MKEIFCLCLFVLMLAGCSTIPDRARHEMVGLTRPDLVACAGIPDQEETRDGQEVLVWKIEKTDGGSLSVSMPFDMSLTFSSSGSCHVIASLRGNKVMRLAYTGPARTWLGADAVCAPVLRACVQKKE
ncbi:hypothetical protein [Acetobacter conturbans]|uniref:Lipoprotein n=1 Tax=Acetobacter conturbans TaxID=1737472 RepID=A0ABX0K1J3_9PROT|nr:hypothetical protein [Acetobacter conturbans]NHN88984.1 hypothetical protein [Acetobacter conturbans]